MTEVLSVSSDDASFRFPRYNVALAKPKPFLMPDPFDPDAVVEILPSAKKTKIQWEEEILVQEIENRFSMMYPDDDDDSYEIEIVEDDGDADFYLEIVDGEVFYVFETEDDISVDDEDDEYMDSDTEVDDAGSGSSGRVLQLPIHSMAAPNLMMDDQEDGVSVPSAVSESFHESMGAIAFQADELDTDAEDDDMQQLQHPSELHSTQPTVRPVSPIQGSAQDANNEEQLHASDTSLSQLSSDRGQASSSNLLPEHDEAPSTPVRDGGKGTIGSAPMVDRIPTEQGSIAMPIAPASPAGRSVASTGVRSILKACPESPKNPKAKKVKGKKGEKSYTKTYVRVDTFDGEHRVYAWQKPDWADQGQAPKLKETDKGSALREGQNLASPITNLPALKGVGKNQSHLINADGSIDQEAVLAKLKKGNPFLKMRNLKMSTKGSMIRSGGDIVKPITMATQNREEDQINKVADPSKLRSTETGKAVKEGKTLALPTTAATQIKKYEFAKPEWATTGPKLRGTGKGEALKSGAKLERDIGGIKTVASDDSCFKPDVTNDGSALKRENGEILMQDINVVAPITHLNRTRSDDLSEERKPPSRSGSGMEKKIEWEKPEWAKRSMTRQTEQGAAIKKGESLSKPITSLPDVVKNSTGR